MHRVTTLVGGVVLAVFVACGVGIDLALACLFVVATVRWFSECAPMLLLAAALFLGASLQYGPCETTGLLAVSWAASVLIIPNWRR